jgi:hypothetical protein
LPLTIWTWKWNTIWPPFAPLLATRR